jgi:CheY-like chemotaxis protein
VVCLTTKRILVIDDEAPVREIVAISLQKLGGWEVVVAASGKEALQQVYATPPDAIVLDVIMPEMDGLTFLKYLRADPLTKSIPVVLLTANSYLFETQHFSQMGVVLAVDKPFSPKNLIQQMTDVLEW